MYTELKTCLILKIIKKKDSKRTPVFQSKTSVPTMLKYGEVYSDIVCVIIVLGVLTLFLYELRLC